ncbi:hypothetical protein [Candidatus Hodarchaeum mangrovi]
MDERILGGFLIIIGLFLAGFGGTAGDVISAFFYIVGFLIAFAGLGLFLKYWKSHSSRNN